MGEYFFFLKSLKIKLHRILHDLQYRRTGIHKMYLKYTSMILTAYVQAFMPNTRELWTVCTFAAFASTQLSQFQVST